MSETVDVGEFDSTARDSQYELAEAYAQRAVVADVKSPMAHLALAKALGG